MPALVRACFELGLTVIPRGGGTGYTGSCVPADAALGGDQHREAGADRRGRADALPGSNGEVPTIFTGAGVVTRRVADAADAAGLVFAVDRPRPIRPASAATIAMNGRRQEGCCGHRARQPCLVADGRPGGQLARSQPGWSTTSQDPPDAALATFELFGRTAGNRPGGPRKMRRERLQIEGRRFRKSGLGKDVTDKFLGGLPGIQKEGCDG